MTVYERFIELKEKYGHVVCVDSTLGYEYQHPLELPIWFAEQPCKHAYFLFPDVEGF